MNYDFDHALIDDEDNLYIQSETVDFSNGNTSLASYDIYFYDVQSNTLYYFHNNI